MHSVPSKYKIKRLIFKSGLATILLVAIAGCDTLVQKPKLQLVWSDEFNYTGLPDTAKWNYDTGNTDGWGNNELQYYTFKKPENARVENGNLVIETRKEKTDSFNYTSARLLTGGKASWQYGKIEVRAKIPAGRGSWPAIWTLADSIKVWPDDGEIDIMEHVGFNQGYIHGSIHCKKYYHSIGTQKTDTVFVADCSSAFHVYSLEWDEELIKVAVDGKVFFSFANEKKGYEYWSFDNKMFLILNIAVGGNWGAQKGIDDTIFPLQMQVDYVRVYQQK
jgi:beta-glucanase (GH16 family)